MSHKKVFVDSKGVTKVYPGNGCGWCTSDKRNRTRAVNSTRVRAADSTTFAAQTHPTSKGRTHEFLAPRRGWRRRDPVGSVSAFESGAILSLKILPYDAQERATQSCKLTIENLIELAGRTRLCFCTSVSLSLWLATAQGLAIRRNARAARGWPPHCGTLGGPLSHRYAASIFPWRESSPPSLQERRELLITEDQHGARD